MPNGSRTRRHSLRLMLALLAVLFPVLSMSLPARGENALPATTPSLDHQIRGLLASCDAIFGVIIIDPTNTVVFEQNADMPFVSASLYKLVLLADILDKVERGELSFAQTVVIEQDFFLVENGEDSYFSAQAVGYEATVEELIYSAGAYSSNVSAQALISLTSRQHLREFANGLGMGATQYGIDPDEMEQKYGRVASQVPPMDLARSLEFIDEFARGEPVNITTPRDMATYFRLLRDDQLVSPLVSWRIKDILSVRVINDRFPALLPNSTAVVHKTGNLDAVLHDVGIINSPGGPVIAIAMSQAAVDIDAARLVEQRLGLIAYEIGDGAPERVATPVATPGEA